MGRWNVTVEFFTGKSEHQFFIEKQDGNLVQGTHKGDFNTREMVGYIDGDHIRFNSVYSIPGDTLNRSEEHTSELQSLMRISYAVFCLKTKTKKQTKYKQ